MTFKGTVSSTNIKVASCLQCSLLHVGRIQSGRQDCTDVCIYIYIFFFSFKLHSKMKGPLKLSQNEEGNWP